MIEQIRTFFFCCLEMIFISDVICEKPHFLPHTALPMLLACISVYLSRGTVGVMVTAHTGFQGACWAHFFPISCSWMIHWRLKQEYCVNIYNMREANTTNESLHFCKACCWTVKKIPPDQQLSLPPIKTKVFLCLRGVSALKYARCRSHLISILIVEEKNPSPIQ